MKSYTQLEPDKYLLCSNYTAGNIFDKEYIVIHHNAGVSMSHQAVLSAFNANGTSAQYDVDATGSVCQYVNDCDTAYHAGNWDANIHSIGIEHANDHAEPWTVAPLALEEGAHLVGALCHAYGLNRPTWKVNVFPHSDFAATACPGELNGSQRDLYMQRAQYWYDVMETGSTAPVHIDLYDKGVYRIYNKATGQHLFTPNNAEATYLTGKGWTYEGVGFRYGDGDPVYRIYNPNTGDHVLVTNHAEHDQLVAAGWQCEGESFRQGTTYALHRLYNGTSHHYTYDTNEITTLISAGWTDEGVAFYVD